VPPLSRCATLWLGRTSEPLVEPSTLEVWQCAEAVEGRHKGEGARRPRGSGCVAGEQGMVEEAGPLFLQAAHEPQQGEWAFTCNKRSDGEALP
jgi:hypothetical protein